MTFPDRLVALGLCLLCGLSAPTRAEDTDLFMGNGGGSGQRPNVLIILDNTANWSATASDGRTKYTVEKEALQAVISQTSTASYNVGLMLFTETGSGNANPAGAYVRYAIREMNGSNRAILANLVRCLKNVNNENVGGGVCDYTTSDKGNGADFALAMDEAFAYFKGRIAYAGHNKEKRDERAFKAGDAAATTNPVYHSPITSECAKNQVIFIANGAPDNGENISAGNELTRIGGTLNGDPIRLNPSGRQATVSDEFARFMALAENDINTYTIDVNPLTTGNGPDTTALLQSMANQGHGRYYAVYNGADLQLALQNALNEILAVNSVYASCALPVSVNVRGTHLNEVYMAEFRPADDAWPRWWGNLKLYQLAVDPTTDTLVLADSASPPQPAQSPITGFIASAVVSYWTLPSSFWSLLPSGTPPSASDSPDGEVVEKGGSAQKERDAWPTRNLYTCTGTCAANNLLSATPFERSNVNVTVAALGATDEAERTALIDWVRGSDNVNPAERAAAQVRPSLHGDVVHSRPAVVNYNRNGTDGDIVVFFGANDGVFRAVKGGKATVGSGSELWGFIAPEFFPKLKRMRDNRPYINFPAAKPPASTANNKPYFFDGSSNVYAYDANGDGRIIAADGDLAYLYVPMRRGGRFLYAFDVSVPETPRFLWKRSNTDTGYAQLGQTWSEPKVAKLNLTRDGVTAATPVIIMGAGYDPAADDLAPDWSNVYLTTMGRGVLVIDALTGNVIWQVGPSVSGAAYNLSKAMQYSIPAGVTIIDRDGNGYADRVYAVDTGANVWRLDIGDPSPINWQVNKLASLGMQSNASFTMSARKFLYAPDVVYGHDANGDYDAVLIGSGDREQPFGTTVINRFFMLKDRKTGASGADQPIIYLTDLYDASDNLIQVGSTTLQANGTTQRSTAAAALLAAKGWQVALDTGEKAVGGAITIAGTVFFGTNLWNAAISGTCGGSLGLARIFAMSYKDGTATLNLDGLQGLNTSDRLLNVPGGGLLPSPTPVILETVPRVLVSGNSTGTYQTVCFGPTCVAPPTVASDQVRRLFWYRCIEGEAEGAGASAACGN